MPEVHFHDPYLGTVPLKEFNHKVEQKKQEPAVKPTKPREMPITEPVKAAQLPLEPFCSYADGHDYIQITQWSNLEGFDIMIESKTRGMQTFALTYGEMQALIHLYTGMSRL